MRASVYWIDMCGLPSGSPGESERSGCVAIMARPRAGDWLEDEVTAWRAAGIDTVVSLLEHDEVEELGLAQEAGLCSRKGMEFISFPIADRGVPTSVAAAANLAGSLANKLRDGKNSLFIVAPVSGGRQW